jgi:hypothetical protein
MQLQVFIYPEESKLIFNELDDVQIIFEELEKYFSGDIVKKKQKK